MLTRQQQLLHAAPDAAVLMVMTCCPSGSSGDQALAARLLCQDPAALAKQHSPKGIDGLACGARGCLPAEADAAAMRAALAGAGSCAKFLRLA